MTADAIAPRPEDRAAVLPTPFGHGANLAAWLDAYEARLRSPAEVRRQARDLAQAFQPQPARRVEFDREYGVSYRFESGPRQIPGYVEEPTYIGPAPHPHWWEPSNPWHHLLWLSVFVAVLVTGVLCSGGSFEVSP